VKDKGKVLKKNLTRKILRGAQSLKTTLFYAKDSGTTLNIESRLATSVSPNNDVELNSNYH